MFDTDLVFATPVLLGPNETLTVEQAEAMHTRSKLTQDFLRGRQSAADLLDYLHDDYGLDTSDFLDCVESNMNHLVDIYGRPLY